MIDEEDLNEEIGRMGYILANTSKLIPSYYKLNDGTILKVIVLVNHLIPDPRHPDGFSINSTNIVSSFVPKEQRRPQSFVPYSASDLDTNIIEQDLAFTVLQEEFTNYALSNGFVLSLKPVLAQVKKTGFFSIDGEPIYSVSISPIAKIKKQP